MLRLFFVFAVCHLVVAEAVPAIGSAILSGYPGDSIWTLSTLGRLGVITISLTGLCLIALVNGWKTRHLLRQSQRRWRISVWILDLALSITLLGCIYVLSPQIFYALYQQLIPGLPDQWVIASAANWDKLADIIIPKMGGSMSDHLASVALGGSVLFTTYLHLRQIS